MIYKINEGDALPEFQIKDHEGNIITHEDLIGSPFILYFYPKDDTPGCTKQACDFRDHMEAFDDLDILVIGVSGDPPETHQKFIDNHDLNFTLLCDENHELAKKMDVWHEKIIADNSVWTIERTTFLIDNTGKICWIERPVNVENHMQRILEALETLSVHN